MRLGLQFLIYPLIAAFWLIMWGLLLRTELRPQASALREVPLEHVEKVIFRHEEGSNLAIHGDGARLGQLQLLPHSPSEHRHVIDCTGGLQLRMPDTTRQRVSWKGSLEMDDAFALQLLRFTFVVTPAPNAMNVDLTVNPVEKWASYVWKTGNSVVDEQKFPLSEAGLRNLAEHLGMDPNLIHAVPMSNAGPMKVTAHQSKFLVHDEKVETYQVTVEQNEQTLLDVQVSQLGLILEAKTLFGWTLENE